MHKVLAALALALTLLMGCQGGHGPATPVGVGLPHLTPAERHAWREAKAWVREQPREEGCNAWIEHKPDGSNEVLTGCIGKGVTVG